MVLNTFKYFIVYLIVFKVVNCIGVEKSNVINKKINLLGTDYNFLLGQVEFDQELYLYDEWVSCPNVVANCPNGSIIGGGGDELVDCSCDYTQKSQCPKVLDSRCSNVCPTDEDDYQCAGDWIVLNELDKQHTFTINKTTQFRYKPNGLECTGISVKVNSIDGYGWTSVGSNLNSNNQRKTSTEQFQRNSLFNLCPSFNIVSNLTGLIRESWTYNTYYIQVSPITESFTFSITLHSIKINSEPVDDCTTSPKCLSINKATQFLQSEIYEFYTLQIKESGYYYFNFPSIDNSILFLISDTITHPTPGRSTWELSNDYENSILLYLEPISDTQPLNIYITSILNLQGVVLVKPSSNVIISVSNVGKRYLTPISSSLSVQAGALSLRGTSRLIMPNGEYFTTPFSSKEFQTKSLYSVLYPQVEFNTIIPAPQYIFDDYTSKSVRNEISQFTTFKPNTYQFSFLLDKSSLTTDIYSFEDMKDSSTLNILSNIFDKNGVPISLNITFRDQLLLKECNQENYKLISASMDKVSKMLDSSINNSQATSLIFNLNLLVMSDTWSTCQTKMNDYYNDGYIVETHYSKDCPYSNTSDPLYFDHPCCSLVASYYQCCNPTSTSVNVSRYTDFNLDRVKSECASLDCTLSVLKELNRTVSSIEECSTPLFESLEIGYHATQVLRECKKVLASVPCTTDNDCSNNSLQGKCDWYKRECVPDFETIDKQYIKCVLDNLSIGAIYYLLNGTTQVNQTVVNTLYQENLKEDCIGTQSIMDRSTYSFLSPTYSSSCGVVNDECLDKSCILHHNICFDSNLISDFTFKLDSRIDRCSVYGFCPSKSECTNSQDCQALCTENSFCGYCSSTSTQCYNIKESSDQISCQNQNNVCLLADGTYLNGLTDEECSKRGTCSKGCGYTCSTSIDDTIDSGCFALVNSKQSCDSISSSQWSSDSNVCFLPLITKDTDCNGQNQMWVDCGSKSAANGECYGPSSNLFICKSTPAKCLDQTQCETQSGECTDQYYFSTKISTNYPSGLGKCVHNHTYKLLTTLPVQCGSGEKDSPEGCFSNIPLNFTKEQCESIQGYRWWTAAQSKEECINNFGCSTIEPFTDILLPYSFKFTEMDKEACEGCQESLNEWKNKYEWTPGKWLPGISTKPQWLTNKSYVSNKVVQRVFNYQSFYSSVILASDSQSLELFKTEIFCKTERIRNSLDSLICSCLASNSSTNSESSCFSESSPVLGQTKVCSNQESEFKFDYGVIKFSNQSIDQTCQIFSISQVAKELYTSTVRESLASNFVSYNKPDNYAVVNSKFAVIGTLLGDGVMISNLEGINQATLCFKVPALLPNKDKYPVLDIALQEDNSNNPTPLDIKVSSIYDNLTNVEYYCANLSEIPSGDPIYFMVNRFQDWRNSNKQLFDRETRGLMYTLACLFLIVSVVGIYEVYTIVYFHIRKIITNFQPIQLLVIFTTIFITIRSIYFFLLVNGKLDNKPALDYILVVLPTFMYFTAFTLIISIWYGIVFLVLKNNKGRGLSVRLYKIIFAINFVLYLFFIAIAVIFQYTQFDTNNDCGSRIVIPSRESNQQKGISLAYAIVQAALSLIIGIAFIYLGRSLYRTISANSKRFSKTNHQNKIMILACICSIAFILHCIFVLVLVSNINSMVFSFIGLIITEIIPVISILYCFNPNSMQKDRTIKETEENNNNNNINNNNNNNKNKKHREKKIKLSKITSSINDNQNL